MGAAVFYTIYIVFVSCFIFSSYVLNLHRGMLLCFLQCCGYWKKCVAACLSIAFLSSLQPLTQWGSHDDKILPQVPLSNNNYSGYFITECIRVCLRRGAMHSVIALLMDGIYIQAPPILLRTIWNKLKEPWRISGPTLKKTSTLMHSCSCNEVWKTIWCFSPG